MLEVERLVVRLVGDASQFNRMVFDSETKLASMVRNMTMIGSGLSRAVTAPLLTIGAASVYAFAKFDSAMTRSMAIMGDLSSETRTGLRDAVLALAHDSTQPTHEIANSLYFLASAGLSAQQAMAALPVVERFATASLVRMDRASELLTDSVNALGLDMSEMARVADVIAEANNRANATAEQFAISLQNKAGAALRLYNKDVEEGVAVLEAYAMQGVKGQRAGEYLNIMLRDVQAANIRNVDTWDMLGISVYDASGKLKNVADIIEGLEHIFHGASDEQKRATLMMMGMTDRSVAATLALVGTSKAIRNFEEHNRKAGGTTQEVAEKMRKSFSAQLEILRNRAFAAGIAIGETLAPAITWLGRVVEKATSWFLKLDEATRENVVAYAALAAAAGPATIAVAALLTTTMSLVAVLFSVPGMIVAATYTLAYFWAKFGEGKEVVDAFTESWKGSWEAIREEISAGNFKEAIEILTLTLEASWDKAMNALEASTVKTFNVILSKIATVLNFISIAWEDMIDDLSGKGAKYTPETAWAEASRRAKEHLKGLNDEWDEHLKKVNASLDSVKKLGEVLEKHHHDAAIRKDVRELVPGYKRASSEVESILRDRSVWEAMTEAMGIGVGRGERNLVRSHLSNLADADPAAYALSRVEGDFGGSVWEAITTAMGFGGAGAFKRKRAGLDLEAGIHAPDTRGFFERMIGEGRAGGYGGFFGDLFGRMRGVNFSPELQRILDIHAQDKLTKSPLFDKPGNVGDSFTDKYAARRFVLEGAGGLARPGNAPMEVKSTPIERKLDELIAAVIFRGLPGDFKRLEEYRRRIELDPAHGGPKGFEEDWWDRVKVGE